MRTDPIEVRAVVSHPPSRVWQVVGNPELYPRFLRGITWCEQVVSTRTGQGARYALRLSTDGGSSAEDEVEIVIHRENEQLVWSSAVRNHRGSVRLRATDGGTEIGVLLTLPAGSALSDTVIRRRLRDALDLVGDHLAGVPLATGAADQPSGTGSRLAVARTLVRAGVLAPTRPDRMLRQLSLLSRWGASVAGGYQAGAMSVPQQTAIIDEQGTRTYAEIDERATRLANGLAEWGVRAGTQVALMCRNHAVLVEAVVACGKLGADTLLLNTGLTTGQVTEVVRRHQPMALLGDDEFASVTRHVPADLPWMRTWPDDHVAGSTIDELIDDSPVTRRQPAAKQGRMVVLTSGTTGAPKAVRRPIPKGLGTAASLLSRIPLRAGERMFVAAPMFHTWGLAAMQLATPLRATLVLQRRFDPQATLRAIAEHRCTTLIAVPVMLQRILDLPEHVRARYDLSSLRVVASSGSALPVPFVNAFMDTFGDILYNVYGSTEVAWGSIADPADLRAAPNTAGRPPLGTRVGILDAAGAPVPPGVVGRVFVGNEMLFDGYTDGAVREVHGQLMDTGDRGYLDADGRLFVSGRDDELVVSAGESVFPRAVEDILTAMPEVRDVAVVGVRDKEWGQRLAAYIVPRPGARLDGELVRSYVHQRTARYVVPRDVFFVDRLPRNETGKILKRLLAAGRW